MYDWRKSYYESLSKKEKNRIDHKEMIKKLGSHVEEIKKLDELSAQGKIVFRYDMSRRYTIIHVYDNETKDELDCYCFSHGLGWMHNAILEYHGRKCVICGISEEEFIEKYGKCLEMHHTTPISYNNPGDYREKSPLSMFVPLCFFCHDRGMQ